MTDEAILVLGANGSIGSQLSRFFLEKQELIVCHYHEKKDKIENLNVNLTDINKIRFIQGDLSTDHGCNVFIDKLKEDPICLKSVIFSIGPYLVKSLKDTTDTEWSTLLDMNVRVYQRLIFRLLPLFSKKIECSVILFGYEAMEKPYNNYCPAYKIMKRFLYENMLSLVNVLPENIFQVMLNPAHMPSSVDFNYFKSKGEMITPYLMLSKKIFSIINNPKHYQNRLVPVTAKDSK